MFSIARQTLFFVLFLLSGCTTLQFQSRGRIPIFVGPKDQHHKFIEVTGKKEFYLWGLLGPDFVVEIDTELENQGLFSAANVRVYEYRTFRSIIETWLSLGFYVPKHYGLTAFGRDVNEQTPRLKRKSFWWGGRKKRD